MKNLLTRSDLEQLAGLRGERLEFFAGGGLWEHLAGDNVVFVTTSATLTVWTTMTALDFEGFLEEYTVFRVDQGDHGHLPEAKNKGYVYYFHSGELIQNIVIVREEVNEHRMGELAWNYTTDVAIILILEAGAIAITQIGMHEGLLKVTHAESLEKLELPEVGSRWREDLTVTVDRKRRILDIAELLAGRED